jgi:hypothetical protein
MTHLHSKAHHLPQHRQALAEATVQFWRDYWTEITADGEPEWATGLEERAVRHTLGCLLARVRGRSPLEYMGDEERDRQAAVVTALLAKPPPTVDDLAASFVRGIEDGEHDG